MALLRSDRVIGTSLASGSAGRLSVAECSLNDVGDAASYTGSGEKTSRDAAPSVQVSIAQA
jgi:hypothetical protein